MIEYFNTTSGDIALIKDDTHICKWIKEHRRLDFDHAMINRVILPYVPNGSVVLNVGAYVGDTAKALLMDSKIKEVHCFEPNPEAFECLAFNLQEHVHRCVVNNYALGEESASCFVHLPNSNFGMANVVLDEGGDVAVNTIDNYCQDNHINPNFIYADIEGFELNMLKGGRETIIKNRPIMVLEINEPALAKNHTTMKQVFDYLDELGYIYKEVYNTPLKKCHTQFDILCFPPR